MIRLSIERAGYRGREVIKNVEEAFFEGSTLILGPSGSGKTTLFLAITGVLTNLLDGYVDGWVDIDGVNPLGEGFREIPKVLGIVLQDPDRQIAMPIVRDEIYFALENLGQEDMEVEPLIKGLGLDRYLDTHVEELSAGFKRRLTLVTAVLHKPGNILLDEPTASLDPWGVRDVRNFISSVSGVKIVIEHKARYFLDIVDRIFILRDGSLEEVGPDDVDDIPGLETRLERSIPPVETKVGELSASISSGVVGYGSPILKDVDLAVHRGEAVALVGRNGSGKSTILKTLAGFIKPLEGYMDVVDTPLYLPQEPDMFFIHPTVEREVRDALRDVDDVENVIRRLPLQRHLLTSSPYRLSHGERRRLLLILASIYPHRLLLMDEPTTGLDPLTYRSLAEEINRLKKVGRALLIATHDPRIILDVCDRAYILRGGGVDEASVDEAIEFLEKPLGMRL